MLGNITFLFGECMSTVMLDTLEPMVYMMIKDQFSETIQIGIWWL